MRPFIAAGVLLACGAASAQQTHPCAAPAIKQARALLLFHHGVDVNLSVDDTVKMMPPVRNPADPQQLLDVLEVNGHVYRTRYRMRLIYKRPVSSCSLMGQEVLESSSR
jgi:hypothetical protein